MRSSRTLPTPGSTTPGHHLTHIRPEPGQAHGGYLLRAHAAQVVAKQYEVAANVISKDDIASALSPASRPEQRATAGFLDRKSAEIDTLIAGHGVENGAALSGVPVRTCELLRE